MSAAISLEGVQVVAAGRVLLDVPRLVIESGERVAVVGPNGAGKSTLLQVMGALVVAAQGRVQVLGRSIGPDPPGAADGDQSRLHRVDRRALRRETGLLMQGLHLVPRLGARENVLIGALARLRGADAVRSWCRWYPRELVAEADAALAALALADRAGTRADRLSGGERQKVALARLQLQRPRLLLADEPTSALDPAATREVCQALCAVAAEPGRTLITVVHDLDLLPLLATRVIGMAEGSVRWDRPIGEVAPPLLQALYQRERRTPDPVTHEAPDAPAAMTRFARA
jgi:phosphonate transport system ATP-binding protein